MSPSPLASVTACAELVLNLILTLVGIFEIISFRFSSDDSPKFRTMRKTLFIPSSSLVKTTPC
uniref:Uncharacterized protein n=1 Tax=Capra hircus TaxID=9925 RepID=A0A452E450_CAPHI